MGLRLRLLRWITVVYAIALATGGTAWLAYHFLTAPVGAFVYGSHTFGPQRAPRLVPHLLQRWRTVGIVGVMAKYVCGNGAQLIVLSVNDEFATGEGELIVHSIDHKKHEVVEQRTPVWVRNGGEPVLNWRNVDHAVTRSTYTDDRGKDREFIRVKGVGSDERGQGFSRFSDDEIQRSLEHLEYEACVYGRAENGLPLGPHLEPRFQNIYYGLDGTRYVLSLILDDLADRDRALWEKHLVEPFGAAWETKDESEPDFLAVTVVARDGDAVVFYNGSGRGEDFRLGTLTADKDENDDAVVQDREHDDSELAALQLALDRKWNPESYRDEQQ